MKPLISIASLSITGYLGRYVVNPYLFTQLADCRDHQYYKA